MAKKLYVKPSIKVAMVETSDLIASSIVTLSVDIDPEEDGIAE